MERFHCLEESTETIDVLIESAYGDGELSQITQSVDAVFQQLGARVIHEVSCAGESIIHLFIASAQSDSMKAFNNRPA